MSRFPTSVIFACAMKESRQLPAHFLWHSVFAIFALLILPGSAIAAVIYVPLWRCVGSADVIVSGTVCEMRDEGTRRMVSTISVLEVIKGDPTLKTVEVRGGQPHCMGTIYPLKGQAGVWLLEEGKIKLGDAATFSFYPESFVPFVRLLAEGKKDESVLDLLGASQALDKEIVEYASSINLRGPAALTSDSALKWAALLKGDLSFVTTIDTPDSVAVAQALAKHKGPLKLPNLKKISPKTLAALVKKEDVEIPLIETLELIQEPDGSITEDFVIPDGFQKGRQRQGK